MDRIWHDPTRQKPSLTLPCAVWRPMQNLVRPLSSPCYFWWCAVLPNRRRSVPKMIARQDGTFRVPFLGLFSAVTIFFQVFFSLLLFVFLLQGAIQALTVLGFPSVGAISRAFHSHGISVHSTPLLHEWRCMV